LQINSVLKSNDFSDSFEDITFYIEDKSVNNELINIFIKDSGGNLGTLVQESSEKKSSTIIAKKGFIDNNKLILYNGIIQTINKKNEYKNIIFEKTELTLLNISGRAVRQPKVQETSSNILLRCIFSKNNNLNLINCPKKDYKGEAIQTLSRRLGSPLYIPLITVIISFLLIYKKEKKYNFLKKYTLFILSFIMLILSEIILKYTSLSLLVAISYFALPLIISLLFYVYLVKKITTERIVK
jgi:lipopolysaccharide export LptBFGC system permease protein LptF